MTKNGDGESQELLTALRHPLRRRILGKMIAVKNPSSPRQISDHLEEPLSNVSYHFRVLLECGAVTLVETEQVRGSVQHFYRQMIKAPWALEVLGHNDSDGRQNAEPGDGAS